MLEAFNLDADRFALLEDQMSKRLEGERARAEAASLQTPPPRLTRLERRVMEAAWACGKASIREILEAFPSLVQRIRPFKPSCTGWKRKRPYAGSAKSAMRIYLNPCWPRLCPLRRLRLPRQTAYQQTAGGFGCWMRF